MAKIISIVNQKGGVGKTTTSVNLGSALASQGKNVLLVDLDPQSNASSGLGVDYQALEKSIYHCLIDRLEIKEIIFSTKQNGFDIAPASPQLAGAGVELVNESKREFRLKELLSAVEPRYDYILVDCPPSLGLLTINGLVGSHFVLIPVQAEYYALEGLGQLLNTIGLIQQHIVPELDVLGAVVTMYDCRNKISGQVIDELKQYFPYRIFDSVIPRSVRLTESPSHGQSIFEYSPESRGALAYEQLAKEILACN